MPTPLQNVAVFLVSTLFSLYILILMLRTLLALSRADVYNPISQFLISATQPVLRPLRRLLPSVGPIDSAAFFLIFTLKLMELWLIALLSGIGVGLLALMVLSLVQLARLVIYIYIVSLIIEAVMSWFMAGGGMRHNPLASLLHSLNRPLLAPLRRALPQTGMIDLSPLVAIIGLNVLLILISSF